MTLNPVYVKRALTTFEKNKKYIATDYDYFVHKLFQSEINPIYTLTLTINNILFDSEYCNDISLFIKLLNDIFQSSKRFLLDEVFENEYLDENSKLFLAAYLADKDLNAYSSQKDFVEGILENSLSYILNTNDYTGRLSILNEMLHYTGESQLVLKGLDIHDKPDCKKLRCLFASSFLMTEHSRLAFNFVRVTAMAFSETTFPIIANLCDYNNSKILNFVEYFKFKPNTFYSWAVKIPYYYDKIDIQNLYDMNRNLFIEATQTCTKEQFALLHMSTNIDNGKTLMELYPECSSNVRISILEYVFNLEPSLNYIWLCRCFDDSSKQVKEKIISLLAPYTTSHKAVAELLTNPILAVRETAVSILSADNDEYIINALKKAFESEKHKDLKNVIANILNISDQNSFEDFDLLSHCKKSIGFNRLSTLYWLDIDTLADVKYKNNRLAERELLKYLLLCYASQEITNNTALDILVSKLSKYSLADLSLEVLERWGKIEYDVHKKWVVGFLCTFADERCISLLEQIVYSWLELGRCKLACNLIEQLVLNNHPLASETIQHIASNTKNKMVLNLVKRLEI